MKSGLQECPPCPFREMCREDQTQGDRDFYKYFLCGGNHVEEVVEQKTWKVGELVEVEDKQYKVAEGKQDCQSCPMAASCFENIYSKFGDPDADAMFDCCKTNLVALEDLDIHDESISGLESRVASLQSKLSESESQQRMHIDTLIGEINRLKAILIDKNIPF